MKKCLLILICLFSGISVVGAEENQLLADFDFYSENVKIRYKSDMLQEIPRQFTDENIRQLTTPAYISKFHTTIADLVHYRDLYKLNDWLFYQLVKKCGETIFSRKNQHTEQVLFSWLVLGNLDYMIQLNLQEEHAYLSVFSLSRIYNVPIKRYGVGWLIKISCDMGENKEFVASFRANQYLSGTRAFSFKLDKLPALLNAELIHKEVEFEHLNKHFTISYWSNATLIEMLQDYPQAKTQNYIDFPLSIEAYNTLIPELKLFIHQMPEEKAVRFLLSFTRQAFQYGEDAKHYQRDNLTFCPEQTLYYNYSDCEDRSVLFAYLVKELLNKEVVIIDFDNHVGVGVRLDKFVGKPIVYNDKYYTFCDPTGPSNDLEVGEYPQDLIDATYSVIE